MRILPQPQIAMRYSYAEMRGDYHKHEGEIFRFITTQVSENHRRIDDAKLIEAATHDPESMRHATRYMAMQMNAMYSWDQIEVQGEKFIDLSQHVIKRGDPETLRVFADEIADIVTHSVNYRVYPYVLTAIDLLNAHPELDDYELKVDQERYEELVRIDNSARYGTFDPD